MKNLSKAYYKDYFTDIGFSLVQNNKGEMEIKAQNSISGKNSEIIEKIACKGYVDEAKSIFYDDSNGDKELINRAFSMEVEYPGLITGVGIDHEAKVEGEFKLGIHLDYTSGLPVIYGSSVKGVLRSAFLNGNLFEILKELLPDSKEDIAWLESKFLPSSAPSGAQKSHDEIMKEWSKAIFGYDGEEKDPRSVYERDIFFDAIVESANTRGRILSSDSITPHKNNPLKDPTPLTFIRIASGCKMKFRFRLVNTALDETLKVTADDKKELFKFILMAFGIGAKTNVGYGRLKQAGNRND